MAAGSRHRETFGPVAAFADALIAASHDEHSVGQAEQGVGLGKTPPVSAGDREERRWGPCSPVASDNQRRETP